MGSSVSAVDVSDYVRTSDWASVHAVVAGIGVAGFACADQLLHLGARVTVVDSADGERQRERAEILEVVGAQIRLGDGEHLPDDADVLVVSPGLPPGAATIVLADRWRLRRWCFPGSA